MLYVALIGVVVGAIVVPHKKSWVSTIVDWIRSKVMRSLAIEQVRLERGWTVFTSDDDRSFRDWLDRDDFHNPKVPDQLPSLGSHLLVELYGCDSASLEQEGYVRGAMVEAARRSNASVVTDSFHEFKPYGVSGAVIIQESHFTIHTWPEHGYAAIDLFYCSNSVAVDEAVRILQEKFRASRTSYLLVRRGLQTEVERLQSRQDD
ncbi:MAG TPA: adenosylmethionine decarboxylase [Fimbriimonadales bacterium]|nr:adenosylmethionine decarboxylase [Fimbriimonadales bacterium]